MYDSVAKLAPRRRAKVPPSSRKIGSPAHLAGDGWLVLRVSLRIDDEESDPLGRELRGQLPQALDMCCEAWTGHRVKRDDRELVRPCQSSKGEGRATGVAQDGVSDLR